MPGNLSLIDRVITNIDLGLRTLSQNTHPLTRPSPAEQHEEKALSDSEKAHSSGLMRVNHSGEVCAQALYQGQALTAKLPEVRQEMQQAADEEVDHLAWCEQRLKELNSQPSIFNPLWYSLSLGLGAGAGLIGDRVSLGFVAATEDQVCQHLEDHLQKLPEEDSKSRAIVSVMLEDEYRHGQNALKAGGLDFPSPIKRGMRFVSKTMTTTSYRI